MKTFRMVAMVALLVAGIGAWVAPLQAAVPVTAPVIHSVTPTSTPPPMNGPIDCNDGC